MNTQDELDVVRCLNDGLSLMHFMDWKGGCVDLGYGKIPLSEVNAFRKRLQAHSARKMGCLACGGTLSKDVTGPLVPVNDRCDDCGAVEGTYSVQYRQMKAEFSEAGCPECAPFGGKGKILLLNTWVPCDCV